MSVRADGDGADLFKDSVVVPFIQIEHTGDYTA